MTRELNYSVVQQDGDERIVHIENVSLLMARELAELLNEKYDFTFFFVEGED